jgi:hypothetical protein
MSFRLSLSAVGGNIIAIARRDGSVKLRYNYIHRSIAMKEINLHLTEIDQKLAHLKDSLVQADKRNFALELVVSWILSQYPEDKVLRFLASQANEMEGNELDKIRLHDEVALFDCLRSQVSAWHAHHAGDRDAQR